MPQPAPERRHLFISYSHADKVWVTRLKTMMAPLLRQDGNELVQLWDDSQIQPGDRWQQEIETALAGARVALLLVSDEFLASEFVMGREVPQLLHAAEAEGVTILWVAVSACLVQHTPIHAYQAVLPPELTLDAMDAPQQRQALVRIAEAVHRALRQAEERREREAAAAVQRQRAEEEARQRQRERQQAADERQRAREARQAARRAALAAPLALTLPLRLPLTRRQLLLTAAGMPLAAIGTTGLVRRLASPSGTLPGPSAPLPGPSAPLSGPIPLQVSHGSLERRNGGWQVRRRLIQLQAYGETLADGVILRLLPIPAGHFLMGSPPEEPERSSDEGPQREVRLQPFLMGQGPITQAQWRVVALWKPPAGQRWQRELKPEPSRFKGQPDSGQRPVENVSWEEAREFCRRLSQRTGRTYTLPSEAQWEYACRAGTKTPFAFGETISPELANYDGNYSFGDGPTGVSRGQTTPVGKFPGNAWGLQDMHGNMWEWCLDHWHENYEGAPIDGSAWLNKDSKQSEAARLLRGGSWFNAPQNCRSACRLRLHPAGSLNHVGFRVCCLPPGSLLGS